MTGLYPGRVLIDGAIVATARVRFFVPGIIQPRLTGRLATAHARALEEWRDKWTRATYIAWLTDGRPTWYGPARIILTAHVTRPFGDGLAAALEPVHAEVVHRVVHDGMPHTVACVEEVRPQNRGVGVVVQRP